MPNLIQIELPYPPTVNTYWRHNRGRTHISEAGRKYREQAAWMCKLKKAEKMTGPVNVVIVAVPPDKRRRDLDNILKVVLDAMQHGGFYDDDSQVHALHIWWGRGGDPRVNVDIEDLRK